MQVLLKGGADIDLPNPDGMTARIARDSAMTNRQGQTALFFAAQAGRVAVVRFLLDRGAGVIAMGNAGKALLNSERTRPEIVDLLRAAMSKETGVAPLTR